jgi:hypothetical protein
MRKRYRVFSLAVLVAVAAVPVGLALTRESGPTVALSRAFTQKQQPDASWISDGVQLAVAGGLFLSIAAIIRRAR